MSVSSLPEWKQLLLERKRREEEERERREKEEEAKLASMPAWKRGIIQRRKAKQEGLGDKDREKEREGFLLPADVKSPSDGLSDTDSSVTVNLGSEPSLSPDPGQWLDAETKPLSQVSMETIVPVHENPFIRTQSGWRKGRDAEKAAEVGYQERGSEQEAEVGKDKEREKDKPSPRGHDGESGSGRDIEMKIEKFRDRSEGRERERNRDKSDGREKERSRDTSEGWERDRGKRRESLKDAVKERERESLKVRKEEEKGEEKDTDPPSPLFAPLVPCLRTIRADNIIIIEQDRKSSDERRGRWRETERERPEEDHQEKIGMKMDLREILAGGGSVTEIRASEVLIIKPSVTSEERSAGGGGGGGGGKGSGREDGEKEREAKRTMDGRRDSMGREHRTDSAWLREKERETVKEKERPWGQATVIKEDRKDSTDDSVFVEKGGRVSQLLSKFGEHPKPPSRSKSSDNFLRLASRKYSEGQDEHQSEERKADGKSTPLRAMPKRSFSFSDRAFCAKENGVVDEGYQKMIERTRSEKKVAPWGDVAKGEGSEKETTAKIKLGRARFLDKDRNGKLRDGHVKNDSQPEVHAEREPTPKSNTGTETKICTSASTVEKVEPVDKRAAEMAGDADGDEGFTVASVKNTEGISFARRVPIRQDGRAKATEREVKRLREDSERTLERERSTEKGREGARQAEPQVAERRGSDFRRGEGTEGIIPAETTQQNYVIAVSVDPAGLPHAAESHYRHASAFTECSSLLCTVADRPGEPHRATEWSGTGPQGPYLTQSVLSQHTEDLISKIERIGETTVYSSERGERAYKEITQAHDAHIYGSENLIHDVIPKSPKSIAPMGAPPGPLEIQIPRTVFYVAEEMVERKSGQGDEGQDREGGRGVERRDSWRIGKPLSRVESLREKIRQREMERTRNMQRGAEDGGDGAEATVTQRAGDRYEERGTEMEREWEAAAHMRKRLIEAERGQEGPAAAQTSMTAFDVTQEVSVLKTSPQLPVSLPVSQAVRGEEVTGGCTAAVSEVISDCFQISGVEDDPLKHVEEELRRHSGLQREYDSRGEEREEEEDELSEEEEEEYTSPLSPSQSLSPSPPHPNSLAAMSRIYNLKTVGSRTGLCVRERAVDIPSVHLVKVKPHVSHAPQESCHQETADVRQLWGGGKLGENKAKSGEDLCGVQAIQRQVEQFQLREQEVVKSSHDGCTQQNTPLRDRETKGQTSPRGGLLHQVKDTQKDQQTSASSPRISELSQRVSSPTYEPKQTQSRVVTITPRSLRSQSPDSFLKPSDCAPTPASSPSSLSPAQSPSISPSPTPSPILFSIRSASGGQVKRGATITITPKKPVGGGGGGGAAAASTPAGPSATKTPAAQPATKTTSPVAEPVKKRYPTVEEIEVIGGYQNLDKSCLVKNRGGTPKRGKVCFDEVQLEQVCEYPSETSMLACTPYPHDLGRDERPKEEEGQEEEEEERGVTVSKSTRNVGTAMGRVLRVDESCPR